MAERLTDDFVQHDHRPLHQREGTREDWKRALLAWKEVVRPSLQAIELLGVHDDTRAYRALFGGHDRLTGGTIEVEIFVVDRLRDNRVCEADLFDHKEPALAHFKALTRR